MKKRTNKKTPKCPVAFALDLFGDRWTLLIIRDLIFKEKQFYGDFLASPEKISTNILADRLGKLEDAEIVAKSQDEEKLSRFVYQLTSRGKDLLPVLLEMAVWSVKHDPLQSDAPNNIINGAPAHLIKRMRKDREALLKEILDKLD